MKRAQTKVEAADGMWFNNNESNNWESDHSTYFGLHFILFEHLELLEHRATLTAGKTKLFCVVYSRKNFVLSGCQCLFSLICSESPKTCDTLLIETVRFNFTVFYFVSCLDILVLKVFRIKPTFCEQSLREDGE